MDSGWNLIDSDAGVFTELVEKLNVKNVQFDDLYSFDTEFLETMKPLYGVVFLFKYTKGYINGNQPVDGDYDKDYQDHGIFFANQTIQNACATQAVLNILMNKLEDEQIGDDLANFRSFVKGFDGMMIGETISNSDLIRTVHNSFSPPSFFVDEEKPKSNLFDEDNNEVFHFVAYIRINGHIYELDGLRQYPIKHIKCETDDDFCIKLPEVLGRRVSMFPGELRFSLLGVTINKLEYYKKIGDKFSCESEQSKRESWKDDNEKRVHDYMGLVIEMLKNISKDHSDEEWDQLIKEARKKGLQRFARQQGRNYK